MTVTVILVSGAIVVTAVALITYRLLGKRGLEVPISHDPLVTTAITEIEDYLGNAFEKKLFLASVNYLSNKADPLRANSFCYSLREVFRHVFDRVAPNANILNCSWFKVETTTGLPSRRQKYIYAVQGGLAPEFVEKELGVDILEPWKQIKDSIDTLSKYTHVGHKTFDIKDEEVDKIASEALDSLLTIFYMTSDTRNELHHSLEGHLDRELMNTFFMNSMSDIDVLSQGSYVEQCSIDNYAISDIDDYQLVFEGDGTVDVSLNYGKRDDACEINENFPFSFEGYSHVDKPFNVSIEADAVTIDTRSWYE